MALNRRKFGRPRGERRYKRLFVIAVEGSRTEPQYFTALDDRQSIIKLECLKGRKDSSPIHVLRRMETRLKEESLRKADEAWLVVDKDEWTDEQLASLQSWCKVDSRRGLALSNPKFEYWLLLHFEDGSGIVGPSDCISRLKRYLPDYDKSLDCRKISTNMIAHAIRRAKQRDDPPCVDWPRTIGTTIYRLVEHILRT